MLYNNTNELITTNCNNTDEQYCLKRRRQTGKSTHYMISLIKAQKQPKLIYGAEFCWWEYGQRKS
jgi:hypothetical protein